MYWRIAQDSYNRPWHETDPGYPLCFIDLVDTATQEYRLTIFRYGREWGFFDDLVEFASHQLFL